MTSPTNPQPTPPAGYEILTPEVARMKPENMKWKSTLPISEWKDFPYDKSCELWFDDPVFVFSAPLGTTALQPTGRCYSSVSDLIKGEGLSIQLESEVKPCAPLQSSKTDASDVAKMPTIAAVSIPSASNAAPADGPNPSPGAAEPPVQYGAAPVPTCIPVDDRPLTTRLWDTAAGVWNIESLLRQGADKIVELERYIVQLKANLKDANRRTRTPPPVAGSGPTAEEMMRLMEEYKIELQWMPVSKFWRITGCDEPSIIGTEAPTLRTAIAQAIQAK